MYDHNVRLEVYICTYYIVIVSTLSTFVVGIEIVPIGVYY